MAGREAEQLVAEADPEHRHAAEQLAHDVDLVLERLGVAGAVREQDAVVAGELVGVDACVDRRSPCAPAPASRRRIERLQP